jgi:hypothetical protein
MQIELTAKKLTVAILHSEFLNIFCPFQLRAFHFLFQRALPEYIAENESTATRKVRCVAALCPCFVVLLQLIYFMDGVVAIM